MGNLKKVFVLIMCMCFATTVILADYASGSCSGSISVTFKRAEFVTGLGWRTGTSRTINFSGNCSGCFWGPGVYGWMTNPLIEYYIGKSGGSSKGSYTCNGRSYTLEVYRQRGKPSIVGTADFDQYNCKGSRDSPVDMGCHLDAWKKLGAAVGTHDYQVVMAEGFGGSTGSANISVSDADWYTHWINGGSVDFKCTGTVPTQTPTATQKTPTPVPGNKQGDVNTDGIINIVDALLTAQYCVGLNPPGFNLNLADTNCDSTINIVDALIIAQYYVGLVTKFC